MKIIAFYLPQYHAIPENDEWWGKGFTEWTNVKKSKPVFKNHLQPEIPLNKNYYCLLDKKIQEEQAELAMKYKVDGFCYYHYWFEGKLLLEKPMENMLKNPNVKISYCVCWANESWARTWDGKEKKVLIKQNYNEDVESWKKHFDYLLPFFKDERYIKDNNRPMMLLYKPYLIKNCKEMMKYWNDLAVENGFEGIYWGVQYPASFFESNIDNYSFDFEVEFEPMYTVQEMTKDIARLNTIQKLLYRLKNPKKLLKRVQQIVFHLPIIYDYDQIWNTILKRKPRNRKCVPGAFTSWDNTPRRGRKATIFYKATPEKFEKYISKQVERAEKIYNSEYLFINAWNEWAEGAHLEPDEKNGYGYLEALKNALKSKG